MMCSCIKKLYIDKRSKNGTNCPPLEQVGSEQKPNWNIEFYNVIYFVLEVLM